MANKIMMTERSYFRIGDRKIGAGLPCFIIAEAGVNHNGDVSIAKKLIDVAKGAGADAVKFQTFSADALASKSAKKAQYQAQNIGDNDESQYNMLKALELQKDDFIHLMAYCKQKDILFLSTPFDLPSVALLEELGVPAYKIASGETVNVPLIRAVAKIKKPMLLSTGMCTLEEVSRALEIVRKAGNNQIALFQCVTNYPASPSSLNLRAMRTMEKAFDVPVGFSDHSEGINAPLAAVILGAPFIEKHFTLDKNMPGPDHKASLDQHELKELVQRIRHIESQLAKGTSQQIISRNIPRFDEMLGSGIKAPSPEEQGMITPVRKSVHAACAIAKGAIINEDMLTTMRPVEGIPSLDFDLVIGKRTVRDLRDGEPINWSDFA